MSDRIVSLLPASTEILAEMGMAEQMVGRSHECDYPSEIREFPILTRPKTDMGETSEEIDQTVQYYVRRGLSIYEVNTRRLKELNPDIIITQDHCEVCAVPYKTISSAVKNFLGNEEVTIFTYAPKSLKMVYEGIEKIGNAVQARKAAHELRQKLEEQLSAIHSKAIQNRKPTTILLEWINPVLGSGSWLPELIQVAGGEPVQAVSGGNAPKIGWRSLLKSNPEKLIISPCGYDLETARKEALKLDQNPVFHQLKAVRNGEVYVVDGNRYINRPGPRLVDSARILAEIIHPELFESSRKIDAWMPLYEARVI